MAVHKRAYRPYEGPLTSERSRFLVLPRFALQGAVRLAAAHRLPGALLRALPGRGAASSTCPTARPRAPCSASRETSREAMRPEFFLVALMLQGALAFLLTAWVAPVLVSPDLVNGALPLLPLAAVLAGRVRAGQGGASCCSCCPPSPGCPCCCSSRLQAGLADAVAGSAPTCASPGRHSSGRLIWIALLTLLAWPCPPGSAGGSWPAAALFGVFFAGSAFGEMWREILGNPWGRVLNLSYLIGIVWRDLFGVLGEPIGGPRDAGRPPRARPSGLGGLAGPARHRPRPACGC